MEFISLHVKRPKDNLLPSHAGFDLNGNNVFGTTFDVGYNIVM